MKWKSSMCHVFPTFISHWKGERSRDRCPYNSNLRFIEPSVSSTSWIRSDVIHLSLEDHLNLDSCYQGPKTPSFSPSGALLPSILLLVSLKRRISPNQTKSFPHVGKSSTPFGPDPFLSKELCPFILGTTLDDLCRLIFW